MDNLLFGSIGVLTETSELQRQALNQALSDFGTGLHWNIATYCQHLTRPGGYARLISAGWIEILHAGCITANRIYLLIWLPLA